MFDTEKVKDLKGLEMTVYQFLLQHWQVIGDLTIREFSQACHVSTTTILRAIHKLGYQGYGELKYELKKRDQSQDSIEAFYAATGQVGQFLKKVNQANYRQILQPAIDLIQDARHIAFSGVGTSLHLANYGTRYFVNFGMNAYCIADPFLPIPPRGMENTLAILLSVSGENIQLLKQAEDFRRYGAKTLTITNDERSTLAKISDYNISYYMPAVENHREKNINLTTQVPVIALLEILAQKASPEPN